MPPVLEPLKAGESEITIRCTSAINLAFKLWMVSRAMTNDWPSWEKLLGGSTSMAELPAMHETIPVSALTVETAARPPEIDLRLQGESR
jgi:hypothetical protein